MKPPKLYTYAFGNIATRLVFYASTAFLGWEYFIGSGPLELLVILLFFSASASYEGKKLTAYRKWKRDWDAMSGVLPKPSFWVKLMSYRLFRLWLLVSFWGIGSDIVCIAVGSLEANYETLRAIQYLGWAGCVIHSAIFIRQWMRAKAKPKTEAVLAVSVCLPLPKAAPAYPQIIAALPAYCQELISRSATNSSMSVHRSQ